MVRKKHAADCINLDFNRSSDEVPVEAAIVRLQHRAIAHRQTLGYLLPLLHRENEEARVEAGRNNHFLPHFLSKFGRQGDAVLVIDRMSELPDDHNLAQDSVDVGLFKAKAMRVAFVPLLPT